MSSRENCVTDVTSATDRLNTGTESNIPNGDIASDENNSDPSPSESPSPTIRFQRQSEDFENYTTLFRCPIIGHEVMEERARFTVYKLRVENKSSGECWFVFRRYTDFVRLHSKLKVTFPCIELSLPRKRWFGDNFNPSFIEERSQGLQFFVDGVLCRPALHLCPNVREFFCLDEPPCAGDSIDESRAIFEALEETLTQLRGQLLERELALEKARAELEQLGLENQRLRQTTRDCPRCSSEKVSEPAALS